VIEMPQAHTFDFGDNERYFEEPDAQSSADYIIDITLLDPWAIYLLSLLPLVSACSCFSQNTNCYVGYLSRLWLMTFPLASSSVFV
jgi:hypothetical protein